MAARIAHTSVDARDAYAQAVFWSRVLGFVEDPDDPNEPGDEECMIFAPVGPGPHDSRQRLLFIEVPEAKQVKNRLHLDLEPAEGTRDDELRRLLALGARVVDDRRWDDGAGWVVLADPEGNEFCILRSEAERAAQRRVPPVTERLVLREFTMADADLVVELDGDPEVMRFVTGGRGTSRREAVEEYLPAWMGYYDSAPGYGFWAAELRATGEFVGWFHLRPAPGHPAHEPELGYRLRRSAWGHGYATEGAKALVDKAFSQLDASRVLAEAMAVNAASRRVMEKAGLRLVRHFRADWPDRIPGEEHGDVEYAIDREEWVRTRGTT